LVGELQPGANGCGGWLKQQEAQPPELAQQSTPGQLPQSLKKKKKKPPCCRTEASPVMISAPVVVLGNRKFERVTACAVSGSSSGKHNANGCIGISEYYSL